MAGYLVTAESINAEMGALTVTLRDALTAALRKKVRLIDDGELAKVTDQEAHGELEASILALDKLARIAFGQDTQPEASDFFNPARKLAGLS